MTVQQLPAPANERTWLRGPTLAGTPSAPRSTHTPAIHTTSRQRTLQMLVRTIAVSDVRDLIGAAGPLSLRDITAGLGVSRHQANAVVGWMLVHGCLQQDEWERYRLGSVVVAHGYRPV